MHENLAKDKTPGYRNELKVNSTDRTDDSETFPLGRVWKGPWTIRDLKNLRSFVNPTGSFIWAWSTNENFKSSSLRGELRNITYLNPIDEKVMKVTDERS